MSGSDYTPLSCDRHDELEALAVRREAVRIRFRDAEGEREAAGIIADIWAEGGAEYLRLDGGPVVRLDRLTKVSRSR